MREFIKPLRLRTIQACNLTIAWRAFSGNIDDPRLPGNLNKKAPRIQGIWHNEKQTLKGFELPQEE